MAIEYPDPIKAEALSALAVAIGNEATFAVNDYDLTVLIPDDPAIYGDDENFDLDKWHQAKEAKILELVATGEFQAEFIERAIGPIMIFKMVRFDGLYVLYHAVSYQAVEATRRNDPNYANLTDAEIAIRILDAYHQTIYSEIFPEGDENNKIHIITDSTSDKLLIKFTNKSERIRGGYVGRKGEEQRVEFFIYDATHKKAIQLILGQLKVRK